MLTTRALRPLSRIGTSLLLSASSSSALAAAFTFAAPALVRCASTEAKKDDEEQRTPLAFVAEATMFPSPDKPKGDQGEDAFFVSKRALGVFDGVGGYRDILKDAGEYSRTFAAAAAHYCKSVDEKKPGTTVDPLHAMLFGLYNTRVMGSSTAAIATIGADGTLRRKLPIEEAAKLWGLEAQTTPGTFEFNFPHQLEYSNNTCDPRTAQEMILKPKQGDLVIACTDGVFDNLFEQDMRMQLAKFDFTPCTQLVRAKRRRQEEKAALNNPDGKTKLERLKLLGVAEELFITDTEVAEKEKECRALLRAMSTMMSMAAQRVGMDRSARSPFGDAAKQAGHPQWALGGKPDDVTVVMGLVVADDEVVHPVDTPAGPAAAGTNPNANAQSQAKPATPASA